MGRLAMDHVPRSNTGAARGSNLPASPSRRTERGTEHEILQNELPLAAQQQSDRPRNGPWRPEHKSLHRVFGSCRASGFVLAITR